jgi:predicted nucleotidyltransferase
MSPQITVDLKTLAVLCRKRNIRKLSLFGSAVRADFQPNSDLDLLVEFQPDHTPGLAFFSLSDELTDLLGRKVDLNTYQSLSPYFREQILSETETLYDATRS